MKNYAVVDKNTRGRKFHEEDDHLRPVYHRDHSRIIHSAAFRRLEYKTQVFVVHEGDHFRTRLTHSLEVAQIAKSMSYVLGLNTELAECLALAHDLGHTPFGHAGGEALNEKMLKYGGFDHNDQTFKIITSLESKYAQFDGLNLSWEVLEGIVKHNGPIPRDVLIDKHPYIAEYVNDYDLEMDKYPSLEAQIASLSDDIAYINHDIEDGLRANLFTYEELSSVEVIGNIYKKLIDKHEYIENHRLSHEIVRRFIHVLVNDLTDNTNKNIKRYNVKTVDDVRNAGVLLADFSLELKAVIRIVKEFLMRKMYKHYKVNRMSSKARRIIYDLFDFYFLEPNCLPGMWQKKIANLSNHHELAHLIADYIASMTDRYAIKEHKNLFDLYDKKY